MSENDDSKHYDYDPSCGANILETGLLKVLVAKLADITGYPSRYGHGRYIGELPVYVKGIWKGDGKIRDSEESVNIFVCKVKKGVKPIQHTEYVFKCSAISVSNGDPYLTIDEVLDTTYTGTVLSVAELLKNSKSDPDEWEKTVADCQLQEGFDLLLSDIDKLMLVRVTELWGSKSRNSVEKTEMKEK